MDFCNECGQTTDPDWVFCRSCGYALDAPEIDAPAAAVGSADSPKVELISRGWDVVDVDAIDTPTDPLLDEPSPAPLPPGAIEVSVDDVTVVEQPQDIPAATAEGERQEAAPPVAAKAQQAEATDKWDHLRPHGQIPGVSESTTLPARLSRIAVSLVALGALLAGAAHFYLNTRLDALRRGDVSARAVDDVELVADASLLVVAGLAVVAGIALIWWLAKTRGGARFKPGPAEIISLAAGVAGIALVGIFVTMSQDSVTAAIAANSLVILGLGLIMLGCFALVRSVTRIEFESPR